MIRISVDATPRIDSLNHQCPGQPVCFNNDDDLVAVQVGDLELGTSLGVESYKDVIKLDSVTLQPILTLALIPEYITCGYFLLFCRGQRPYCGGKVCSTVSKTGSKNEG